MSRTRLPWVGKVAAILALAVTLPGCQDPNALAMKLGARPDGGDALKAAQTRVVSGSSQPAILSDVTQVLQDLGYSVKESSADLGVVTADKSRDATESGQVAGQVALTVLLAFGGMAYSPTWDRDQRINVTSVVVPAQRPGDYALRVSFDRYLWNNHGLLWKTELVKDPAIYQEFFNKFRQGQAVTVAGAN